MKKTTTGQVTEGKGSFWLECSEEASVELMLEQRLEGARKRAMLRLKKELSRWRSQQKQRS